MLSDVSSRLGMVALLFTAQLSVWGLELLVFTQITNWSRWYNPVRQFIAPAFAAVLGAVLVSLIFGNPRPSQPPLDPYTCDKIVDADIGEDGVRIATWAQLGVLTLVSFIGSFHVSATGVKEVGAGLVLTHVSLAIALIVQMGRGSLSLSDAIIGALILDAQNMAVTIQLGAKETLAARWQVGIVLITQAFGLAIVPVLVWYFIQGSFARGDCLCLTVYWWGWLSNCQDLPTGETSVFWVYYACRCMILFQSTYHSIRNTWTFHLAEKDGIPLERITYPYRSEDGDATYKKYPATVTLTYAFYAMLAATSMATAESTLTEFNIRPSSSLESVGQVIAVVIAAATILRAGWLFVKLFQHPPTEPSGFIRPFSLAPARLTGWSSGFILVSDLRYAAADVKIGSIIADPTDPMSSIGTPVGIPDDGTKKAVVKDVSFSQSAQRHQPLMRVAIKELRTSSVEPKLEAIREHAQREAVRALPSHKLYFISGVKVATGITKTLELSHGDQLTEPLPTPMVPVGRVAEHDDEIVASAPLETQAAGEAVWAYRLHVINTDKKGDVESLGGLYTESKLLAGTTIPDPILASEN